MEGNTLGFWWELAAGSLIESGAYGALPGQNAMRINQRHTDHVPPASPQVVQSRKHSLEVRIAEQSTPYKFSLILAPARLTSLCLKGMVDTLLSGVKLPTRPRCRRVQACIAPFVYKFSPSVEI